MITSVVIKNVSLFPQNITGTDVILNQGDTFDLLTEFTTLEILELPGIAQLIQLGIFVAQILNDNGSSTQATSALDFQVPLIADSESSVVSSNFRSGSTSVPLGATTITVAYSSPLTGNYVVTPTFVNTVDPNPQIQTPEVIAQDQNGFTVIWGGALDTANYVLNYVATKLI